MKISLIIQLARFATGCYIEMTTSPPLAHEYVLVIGWKRILGERRALAGPFMNWSKKIPIAETTKISFFPVDGP